MLPHDADGDPPGLFVVPDGRTVYIWAWEVGLARSGDGGATWSRLPLPDGHVEAVAVDPFRPRHLWLQMGSGSPTRIHLYRGADAGSSWREVSAPGTPVAGQFVPMPMAADPEFPGALWIATDHALFHTVDAGRTWDRVGGGLPPAMPVIGIAVSLFDGERILAWRQGTGMYASDDGGRTWRRSTGPFPSGYACHPTFDPLDHRHIYVACSDGLYVSGNGGRTWARGAGIVGATEVLVSTGHPRLAYLAGWDVRDGGFLPHGQLFRTTDGGGTWHPWSGGDLLAGDTIQAIAGVVP